MTSSKGRTYLRWLSPTLDLALAETDRHEAARQLVSSLEGPGFLYLKNVQGYDPGTVTS